MLDIILNLASNYLIEFMGFLLGLGLIFRWASYHASKREDIYFSTFTSEVEKQISMHKDASQNLDGADTRDVEIYLDRLLESVKNKLPSRTIRHKHKKENRKMATRLGAKNVVSLRDYVTGEKSLFHSIKVEGPTFKNKYPPNFQDLTNRILEKDDNWNKLLGFFPIAPIARLNDVMPGLFVVFGIFGTFIGISMALPEIAKIDFNNLDASGDILTSFVLSVTYAMKTSIAGILFSLVMTFINTLAPIRGLRQKTFKKMTKCFENIWISMHGKKSTEEELSDQLPKLISEVERMRELLEKQNKALHKKGA